MSQREPRPDSGEPTEGIPEAELERMRDDIDGSVDLVGLEPGVTIIAINPNDLEYGERRETWSDVEFEQIAEVVAPLFATTPEQILAAQPPSDGAVAVGKRGKAILYVAGSLQGDGRHMFAATPEYYQDMLPLV